MADWQRAASVAEVPVGTAKELVLAGRIVALFNVEGQFHAIDGICAHQGGPLAKGQVVAGIVTCPWHGWQYDVSSGQHCLNARLCQTRFETKVEGDEVFVQV